MADDQEMSDWKATAEAPHFPRLTGTLSGRGAAAGPALKALGTPVTG